MIVDCDCVAGGFAPTTSGPHGDYDGVNPMADTPR